MQSKKVNISGVNTYKLPVLSGARMRELFHKMHDGDHDARQELINGNLRLVLSVLQRFKNRGENLDDLFQVGCIGLMKAVDNFSLAHNVHFSTYAVPMIIGEIKRHLRDNNAVRVSRSLKMLAQKAQQVREELTRRLLREPTVQEIARELEVTPEELVFAPIVIFLFTICSAILAASSFNLASLWARCLMFSAKTFLADSVAAIAFF